MSLLPGLMQYLGKTSCPFILLMFCYCKYLYLAYFSRYVCVELLPDVYFYVPEVIFMTGKVMIWIVVCGNAGRYFQCCRSGYNIKSSIEMIKIVHQFLSFGLNLLW